MIPWKGSSATHINYVTPFAITATLNVSQFVIGFLFLKETLPPELRVPFRMDTFNTIRQSGILWSGPTGEHGSLQTNPRRAAFHTEAPCAGISDRRFFRRLAFTVFVQGIGMDGCFLVIGFYIKQQFAISKNQNTMMMETQGLAAIFVMWVLCKTTALSLLECTVSLTWEASPSQTSRSSSTSASAA